MNNELKPYGPFGMPWSLGGYGAAGVPVANAYAPIEEGMLWLTDTPSGGRGAVMTELVKPSVSVSGPETPWNAGNAPMRGHGRPESVFTEGEQNELVENMAGQISVGRRLESARSQGVRDAEAETLWEDLLKRQGELRQSGERRGMLRNSLLEEMGRGTTAAQPSVAMAGGGLGRELEPWEASAQAAGGTRMNQNLSRTYTDSEADELIRIMLDTRRVASVDDPKNPSPEVAAKLAELEAREQQINATADARAAGEVGIYGPGMVDVPLYGTEIGLTGEVGQPAGQRMLTSRDIELGGYNGKGSQILLPGTGVSEPSVSEQVAPNVSEEAVRRNRPTSKESEDLNSRVDRAINNGFNSLLRGAVTDGYQMAAEGLYNLAGGVIGRNKYSNMPTPELRAGLEDLRQEIAVEGAAIKEQFERHSLGLAPLARYGELKGKQSEMLDELEYREGKGEGLGHWLRGTLEWTQDEASRWREASREALPVDEEFANSMPGKVLHGVGGLSMLPLYGTAAGPVATVGQVYQEGIDDYRQEMAEQGRPVDPDQANRAAMTYLATAAPMEVLLDKLIVGKVLKAAKGKMTVGRLLKRLGIVSASGAVTDGGQQAWLNTIASQLEGYDPERPVTQGVMESAFYSAMLSPMGGAASHYVQGNGASSRPMVGRPMRRQSIAGGVLVPDSWERFRKRESPADDRGGGKGERQEEQPETDSEEKVMSYEAALNSYKAKLEALQEERRSVVKEIEEVELRDGDGEDIADLKTWLDDLNKKLADLRKTKPATERKDENTKAQKPKIGKPLDSEKHKIPKAGGKIVPVLLKVPREVWVSRVADWMEAVKTVQDPDGNVVLLANPEDGSIAARALHLIGSYLKSDRYKKGERVLMADKAKTVFSIPKTISDYQVKAVDGNRGMAYVRRYGDGMLHMVIVEMGSGAVKDHLLISQREIEHGDGVPGFSIQKVRDASQ